MQYTKALHITHTEDSILNQPVADKIKHIEQIDKQLKNAQFPESKILGNFYVPEETRNTRPEDTNMTNVDLEEEKFFYNLQGADDSINSQRTMAGCFGDNKTVKKMDSYIDNSINPSRVMDLKNERAMLHCNPECSIPDLIMEENER